MDQEKGEEGVKERSVSVSQRIGFCLCESGSENVTAAEASLHCACVCVCMDLVELRCHICEDYGFKLVATRDEALNH